MIDRRLMLTGALASAAEVAACVPKHKEPLTVVSYGAGTYQASHQDAFLKPFARETGIKTISTTWNAEYAKLRAMVESGKVDWDVVDVTAAILARGRRDGLFEKIGALPDADGFLPGTLDPFGVGNVYWATVLAYDSRQPNRKPVSWADFFDTRAFPGPRALYDDPRANIEFALLASGVPKAEVYPFTPEKLKEAFSRLSAVRDSVRVWWSDGSQPVQLLLTKQVVMTSAWSGRIFASPQAKAVVDYPWSGAALELDYWTIPKGSRHARDAAKLIAFASRPDRLAAQANLIGYGPVNTRALEQLPGSLLRQLPTYQQNFEAAFVVNSAQWERSEDELRSRWLAWKTTGHA